MGGLNDYLSMLNIRIPFRQLPIMARNRSNMTSHQKFSYNNLSQLQQDIGKLGLILPISVDFDYLKTPIKIGEGVIPNRLAIQPLEGFDATLAGSPGSLMKRRYERFAKGRAGAIWIESCAVSSSSKSNSHQLFLNDHNVTEFEQFVNLIRKTAENNHQPYLVLQLSHSGRYSRKGDVATPVIAMHNPYLERPNCHVITDEELEQVEDEYVEAARLAQKAGFDAVDIRACHGYLINELLAAHERTGKYGGRFENRVRFLLNIVAKIKQEVPIEIAVRLNAYDSIPFPYGWGVDKEDYKKPDLAEPLRLIELLSQKGIRLINISCGYGSFSPHVIRPYDIGPYIPKEHPLVSIHRMLDITRQLQQAFPHMIMIASAFSWLREYAPHVASGCIREGWFAMAGFGRQALAYPDFAKDVLVRNEMDKEKCCITCSNCMVILKDGNSVGCIVRDSEIYADIFKKGRANKPSAIGTHIADHL